MDIIFLHLNSFLSSMNNFLTSVNNFITGITNSRGASTSTTPISGVELSQSYRRRSRKGIPIRSPFYQWSNRVGNVCKTVGKNYHMLVMYNMVCLVRKEKKKILKSFMYVIHVIYLDLRYIWNTRSGTMIFIRLDIDIHYICILLAQHVNYIWLLQG